MLALLTSLACSHLTNYSKTTHSVSHSVLFRITAVVLLNIKNAGLVFTQLIIVQSLPYTIHYYTTVLPPVQLALSTGTVSAARHIGPLACFLVCFLVIGSPSYIIGDFDWQELEKYYTDLDLQTPASCRQLYWGGLASSCWIQDLK